MYERLYRSLYRIRRVEEEVARLYPTDRIKSPVHLSIGQEAVSVGVCDSPAARRRGVRQLPRPRALPRQGRRPESHDRGVVRPGRRLLARQGRVDAPDRPGSRRDGHVRRGRHDHPERRRLRLRPAISPNRSHRGQLLRRRRHGGGRLRGEPEFRGPQAAAGPVRLREQPLRHPHPPGPAPGDSGDLRPGHRPRRSRRANRGQRCPGIARASRRGHRARSGRRGAAVHRGHDLPLAGARRPRPRLPPRLSR